MFIRSDAVLFLCLSGVACGVAGLPAAQAETDGTDSVTAIEEGKQIAFDRDKGNCLACHQIADGIFPGNIGPPLMAMKQRFPDKAALRQRIFDATAVNPDTVMPPFGRHGILTPEEIDKVTDFIYSL